MHLPALTPVHHHPDPRDMAGDIDRDELPFLDRSLPEAEPTNSAGEASQPHLLKLPSLVEATAVDYPLKLASQLDRALGCAVWLTQRSGSGRILENAASPTAKNLLLSLQDLEAITADASQTSLPIGVQCPDGLPTSPSAIMDQVWATRHGLGSMSMNLPSDEGARERWIITLAWKDAVGHETALQIASWLDLNAATLGKILALWSVHRLGFSWQARLQKLQRAWKRPLRWVLLAGLALGLLMLVPLPYHPKRECRIEPGIRRYIASPIEGRLQSVAVRPGEEVRTGQLLAKLDDMPLVRELAAAEAELQTHHKRRDVALATRAGGDLRIAQLEMQQIQLKIDALKDQLQRLEITSPCDGVLVQGDWFGNDGMPVSFGQNLFEIAPLDKMVAEIHLLAEDLPWVAVGSQAVMRTDTSLHRAWTGTIDRIEPRAEVVDEEAVFIGEMEIENQEHLFRPGMKARVAVDTGMKSIGWILFRKPYRWLQNQWIW